MSEHIEKTEQPIKPTTPTQELNEKELEKVSGGINPQPLPPAARRQ